jgi:hypothetical protein
VTTTFLFLFFYGFGVLCGCLNSVLTDAKRFSRLDLVFPFLIALASIYFGFYYREHAPLTDVAHWFTALLFFSAIFGLVYKERILPKINKFTVYYFTLVYWYYLYFAGMRYWEDIGFLYWVSAVPSVISSIAAFREFEMTNGWKLFNYIWYMTLMAAIGLLNINGECVAFFGNQENSGHLSWPEMFLSGMAINFIVVMLINLFVMIPLPSRGQSYRERLKDWDEDKKILEGKMSNVKIPVRQEIFITVFLFSIFGINYLLHIVSFNFMGNIAIVVIPIFFSFIFTRRTKWVFKRHTTSNPAANRK